MARTGWKTGGSTTLMIGFFCLRGVASFGLGSDLTGSFSPGSVIGSSSGILAASGVTLSSLTSAF
jgi:hypothetical protein